MFVKHAFIIALAIIPSILAVPVPDARTTAVTQSTSQTSITSLQTTDAAEKLTREEMKLTDEEEGVKPAMPKLTRRSPTPGANQSHDSRPSHLHWPTRSP
ncbi:hypothetical protein FRC14_006557 [Serendipita sp. 396]|nr:hypothetical protein FRC14_006557 [Serendipita sp. 396]KAG8786996.1 hypothetical protein FRC15_010248 [Serendipita sp. 397]KAG8864368.1 hypothetical protein FRC20_010281 [Serendipita sp. 405]